jgi:hypothetical protein
MNLKPFVNNTETYSDFQEWVSVQLDVARNNLERTEKIEQIYRLQGEVSLLKRLLRLREEINGRSSKNESLS